MSESGGDRPDVSKAFWATDPLGFGRVEPAGSKKLAGYDPGSPPGTPGEIPTGTDHNWLFGFWADILQWLDGAHVREFEDLGEAIAAVTTGGQLFRIGQPSTGNRAFGAQVYSLTPTAFTALADACSDGGQVYYLDNAGAGLFAANPDDGSQVWLATPSNVTPLAVAADGRAVYLSGSVTSPGLVVLDRDTGLESARGGGEYAYQCMASNGSILIGGEPSSNTGKVFLYDVATSPPFEDPVGINHNAQVNAVEIDERYFYFGGNPGLFDLNCYDFTKTVVWQNNLTAITAASPTIRSIKSDGSLLYVGTDRVGLTAGGFANFFVLSCETGSLYYYRDIQTGAGTDNITHLAIDGEYIYATLDGATGHVVVFRVAAGGNNFHIIEQYATSIIVGYDADGIGLICTGGSGTAERNYYQTHPVTFERVGFTSPVRRPFQKLALPIRRMP